jgi:hypothetical protein
MINDKMNDNTKHAETRYQEEITAPKMNIIVLKQPSALIFCWENNSALCCF